jgi:hypothetical protein
MPSWAMAAPESCASRGCSHGRTAGKQRAGYKCPCAFVISHEAAQKGNYRNFEPKFAKFRDWVIRVETQTIDSLWGKESE